MRDLDTNARVQLRDSLIELLWESTKGPKVIMVHLCLALADLAIQMLDWKNVIPDLVEKFKDTPLCLLELLLVLPEEMNNNTKLPLTVSVTTFYKSMWELKPVCNKRMSSIKREELSLLTVMRNECYNY